MNDFVLRGFCKKCGCSIDFDEIQKGTWCDNDKSDEFGNYMPKHPSEPVWFLSAKQMQILNDYLTKMDDETFFGADYDRMSIDFTKMYGFDFEQLLNQNPFLVSKILKDTGEKIKEENK